MHQHRRDELERAIRGHMQTVHGIGVGIAGVQRRRLANLCPNIGVVESLLNVPVVRIFAIRLLMPLMQLLLMALLMATLLSIPVLWYAGLL